MEYESDILKRLIDTYGVVGNPRYISEIIKEFIIQGKERYPELFTYQSDWLAHIDEFGLNPSYTVSYTGQSIYAPNTLERPVKSAILKGRTLINLITNSSSNEISNIDKRSDGFIINSLCTEAKINYLIQGFETSTQYTLVFNSSHDFVLYMGYDSFTSNGWSSFNVTKGLNKITLTSLSTNPYPNRNLLFRFYKPQLIEITELMLLKGDYTNQDITYLEGMQTVRMPVLTTSNGDGTKTNILTVNEDVTLRSNGDVYDELNLLTGRLTQRIDENNEVLSQEVVKTVDLNILNQNGQNVKQLMSFNGGTHFNTGSLEGSPLPSVSVIVETDLEETLKVCSLEGNTM